MHLKHNGVSATAFSDPDLRTQWLPADVMNCYCLDSMMMKCTIKHASPVQVLQVEVSGSVITHFPCLSFHILLNVNMSEGPTVTSVLLSHFIKLIKYNRKKNEFP